MFAYDLLCRHKRASTCTYTYTCTHKYTCTYTYPYTYAYIGAYESLGQPISWVSAAWLRFIWTSSIHTVVLCRWVFEYVYMCACICVCICISVCIWVCMWVDVGRCTCRDAYVPIFILESISFLPMVYSVDIGTSLRIGHYLPPLHQRFTFGVRGLSIWGALVHICIHMTSIHLGRPSSRTSTCRYLQLSY